MKIHIAICLLLTLNGCSTTCDMIWNQIYDKFDEANYCDSKNDCVIADNTCCGSLVNIDKKTDVEKYADNKIQRWPICQRECDCAREPSEEEIVCTDNKCVDTRYE